MMVLYLDYPNGLYSRPDDERDLDESRSVSFLAENDCMDEQGGHGDKCSIPHSGLPVTDSVVSVTVNRARLKSCHKSTKLAASSAAAVGHDEVGAFAPHYRC